MERGSTIFLRAVVLLMGLIIFAICALALPAGIRHEDAGGYIPILLGLYVPTIPFYIALHQTLKLLSYIDQNKAFSELSIKALKTIKYCALAISGFFTAGLPYIYLVAEEDDAPGVIVIGMLLAFAPMVVAVFAAVLQKLLQNAIAIKSENDLTV